MTLLLLNLIAAATAAAWTLHMESLGYGRTTNAHLARAMTSVHLLGALGFWLTLPQPLVVAMIVSMASFWGGVFAPTMYRIYSVYKTL